MYQLYYEIPGEKTPLFPSYKLRWDSILSFTLYNNLSELLEYTLQYPSYHHYFLLDENRFSFFKFDIFTHHDEGFRIQDLHQIIDEKCSMISNNYHVHAEKLTTYVDTIFINGEQKKFLIGERGEIFFRLYIVFLQKTTYNTFAHVYGNFLQKNSYTLIPQSLYTVLFLRDTLKKDNFLLLYINENEAKILKIENGFYTNIERLNLWTSALKLMYKDNGILQYRNKASNIDSNPLAKQLVEQTMQFYSQLLCNRIHDIQTFSQTVFLISPIVKNQHFLEIFNQEYNNLTQGFIVPFHHSESLDTFNKKWDPEDMDTLVCINREKQLMDFLHKNTVGTHGNTSSM